jgi:protein-L-isoaspartate(D-aspartate) O-methyltransferase
VTEHAFDLMRRAMVTGQLRTTAVNDPRVVAAMSEVPREHYVPADKRALAYLDLSVPLGHGRALPSPMVTGKLLTNARVRPTDRVLVVGAGPGYSAAVAAILAASVVALDTADAPAGPALPANVSRVHGPLAEGWAAGAPYDVILLDGAVEEVPAALVAQLADGGRLATGLLIDGVAKLAIGLRSGDSFGLPAVAEAEMPVLPGFAKPAGFRF